MGVTAWLQAIDRMRENLLYGRDDLAVRDRIRRVQQALAQDETTTAAILRAEYGGDSINGLDIKAFPAHPVNIVVLEKAAYVQEMGEKERAAYLRNSAGSAGASDNINLRQHYIDALRTHYRLERGTLMGMAHTVSTVGHENTHRLQFAQRQEGWLFGAEYTSERRLNFNYGGGIADKAMAAGRYTVDFLTHMKTGKKVSDYFATGPEIQARMHEIMVAGHAQWGKLPASKMELHAALYNLGVSVPLRVRWALATSAEGRQALDDFRCSARVAEFAAGTVADMNRVMAYAMVSGLRGYVWDTVLPQQYGHLIEMYGDGPGRARMGLGSNPAPAIAAAALVYADEELSAERARALAATIPPDWSNQFFNSMAGAKEFTPNQRVMAAALLARAETRDAIVKKEQSDTARQADEAALPKAIMGGNAEAVEMLLAAGYDPLQRMPNKWLNGEMGESWGAVDIPWMIRDIESRLTQAETGLSKKFNNESFRSFLRDRLALIDAGVAGVVRHYGENWMETAPPEMRDAVALARDRVADAARRAAVPGAPAAGWAAGVP